MEIINENQIEVNCIRIMNFSLMAKRDVFRARRTLFLAQISEITESKYMDEDNNIKKCRVIIKTDGEWIRVADSYDELRKVHSDWWFASPESVKEIKEG